MTALELNKTSQNVISLIYHMLHVQYMTQSKLYLSTLQHFLLRIHLK